MGAQAMIESVDPKERAKLQRELTGPLRAQGRRAPEDEHAPAWWHGEEEAYESTMAALPALRQRRSR